MPPSIRQGEGEGGRGGAFGFITAMAAILLCLGLFSPSLPMSLLPGADAFVPGASAWAPPPLSPPARRRNLRDFHPTEERFGGFADTAATTTTGASMGMFNSPSSRVSSSLSTTRRRRRRPSASNRRTSLPSSLYLSVNGEYEGGDDASNSDDDANKFTEFAASMLTDEQGEGSKSAAASAAAVTKPSSSLSSSKAAAYRRPMASSSTSTTPAAAATETWKRDLDELLNVSTSNSRRQTLLQRLLNSNQEIRSSVEQALKDRTVRYVHDVVYRGSSCPKRWRPKPLVLLCRVAPFRSLVASS
jgi:hypothetical protein